MHSIATMSTSGIQVADGRRVRILPREHGTWAMLIIPWAIGAGMDLRISVIDVLVLLGATALFLAHLQLTAWWRRRLTRRDQGSARTVAALGVTFGTGGLAAIVPFLIRSSMAWVVVLGAAVGIVTAVSLWLVTEHLDRKLPGQTLAALGLSLAAPATYAVGSATRAPIALTLWALAALFFVWAVFYVRLEIAAKAHRAATLVSIDDKLGLAGRTLALDGALLIGGVLALRVGGFTPGALLVFAPAAVQAVAGVLTLERRPPLRRIGVVMTVHAALFAVLVIVVLH